MKYLFIFLRVLAAIIMLQTLYFKFTGHEDSVQLFSTLEMEPWGRIGTGIVELIASILLFIPGRVWIGAMLGLGTMSGAIFFHLTKIGINFREDGGALFSMAMITFVCCLITLWHQREYVKKLIGV